MATATPALAEIDNEVGEEDETGDELLIRPPVQKKLEQQRVREQLDAASVPGDAIDYELPSLDLLLDAEDFPFEAHEKHVRTHRQAARADVRQFRLQRSQSSRFKPAR